MEPLGINILGLAFVGIAALALIVFIGLRQRAKGFPALRDIKAFDFLPNTVGEAVETGKRMHISLGTGTIGHVDTAATLAGLKVMELLATLTVVSDKPPVVTTSDGTAMLLAQNTLQAVYTKQFAEERYDPTLVRVAGLSPLSFGTALTSTLNDESVAGNVLIGPSGPEALLLAEASQRAGQPLLATSHEPTTQGLLYPSADHTLIGEDLFAGLPYLAPVYRPDEIASLQAQDVLRFVVVAAILIGVLGKSLGIIP